MAAETFSEEEFDQLEREVAAIFFPRPAEEVEDAKDSRITSILRRVEQDGGAQEDDLP